MAQEATSAGLRVQAEVFVLTASLQSARAWVFGVWLASRWAERESMNPALPSSLREWIGPRLESFGEMLVQKTTTLRVDSRTRNGLPPFWVASCIERGSRQNGLR